MIDFHKILSRILVVILAVMIFPFQVHAQSKIIDQIKIGIRYGESATPLVSLYGRGGLDLGYYSGNEFMSIMSFLNNEELLVRKDSYFMSVNGTFIEYNYDEQNNFNNTSIQGPIHIQIGDSFNSLDEANYFMNAIPKLMSKPYIVYEDGWRVWIGLYTSFSNAEEVFENIKIIMPESKLKIISKDNKRLQVLSKSGEVLFMYKPSNEPYHFRAVSQNQSSGIIQLDGKNFRGNIIINRYANSDLTVINQVGLEEYLYGVVPKEMSGEWPIEAQKAQAVAARNYAIVNLNKHADYGFDLCASTHCQVYGGYSSEHPKAKQAVDETKGKLLNYEGKLVTAFYHSNSGGRTEDAENVWSTPVPYLKGVEDPYSIGAPNDKWIKAYTKVEIENILASKDLSVGKIESISILERSQNGRVIKMEVSGSGGKKILEKEKVRSVFGYNNIKSTWFDIMSNGSTGIFVLMDLSQSPNNINISNKYVLTAEGMKEVELKDKYIWNGEESKQITSAADGDQYTFSGKGWGHGLGMSQWGAKKMAEEGMTYEQILTHYYTGTKVE